MAYDIRLEDATIDAMARDFAIHARSKQQVLVDQLGNHPVNHARFARLLNPQDWQVYLALTAWIN